MESNKNFQCRYAKMNMDQHCINTDQENNMVIIKQEKPDLTEVFSESSKLHNGNQIKDLQNNKEETPQLDNLNDSGTRNLNTDISIKRETPDKQDEWIDEQEGIFFVDNDLGSNDIHCDTSSLSLRCDVNMKEEDVNEKKPENSSQPELVDKGIDQSCVPSSSKYLGLVKTEDDKVALDDFWQPNFHSIFENQSSIIGETSFGCIDLPLQKTSKSNNLGGVIKKAPKEKKFQCAVCDFKTAYRKNIKMHLVIHSGEKNIHCQLCDFKTARRDTFRFHMKEHTGEEKTHHCNLCGYKTDRIDHLKRHMKIHTGERDFHCTLCDFKTMTNSNLQKHIKVHTGEKGFHCDLCDFKTARTDTLKLHMKIHTGIKEYKCGICEFKTGQKSNLTTHIKIHSGEKDYHCSFCDFKTARSGNLKAHMKAHTTEKNFSCDICNFKTFRKDQLLRHEKVHTKEKCFYCELCEYMTGDVNSLRKHIKIHAEEKNYDCDLCTYKTFTSELLNIHLKVHKDLEDITDIITTDSDV